MVWLAFLLGVLLTPCNGANTEIPTCIQQMIEEEKQHALRRPSGAVYSYLYRGQRVYYFRPPCCDQLSKLYDENCNFLCAPDGGFTGMGDGQCPDFHREKTQEQLLWKASDGP